MGKNKNVSMTHEEIWDDSALVQSWDDAVEEYQLYHSIHAKGENVEDVLRAAEGSSSVEKIDEAINDQEEARGIENDVESEDVAMSVDETTSDPASQAPQPVAAPAEASTAAMPMPHPMMANVKDEALKNLMMSWYYAGYYTGLHEGQQQASQSQSS